MKLSTALSAHFKEVFEGNNWTGANYKEALDGLTWADINKTPPFSNSIATLFFHSVYYVQILHDILLDKPLVGKDVDSFELPKISTNEEWLDIKRAFFELVIQTARLITQREDDWFMNDFVDPKYGSNYRNIAGNTEHLHYHLGQINLVKKYWQIQN